MAIRVDREQILAHRRHRNGLDGRTGRSPEALRRAAQVGLTDSMPRAAALSLHARVDGITSDVLDDPTLTQVWGPRFSVYVVAERDVAAFTLGRLPTDARGLARATDLAERLARLSNGEPMRMSDAGRALGIHPNALRYASPTGTLRIRWDGARQPTVAVVDAPDVDPHDARLDLARRYLHVMGPASATSFAQWAGVKPKRAAATFDELGEELVEVTTPIGTASVPASDVDELLARPADDASGVRLLPSGDAFWLLWDGDRRLLVADDGRRRELWTSRVWPGAVLVDGEIVGVWRRSKDRATVTLWTSLPNATREQIEAEAASMPLPAADTPVRVVWDE